MIEQLRLAEPRCSGRPRGLGDPFVIRVAGNIVAPSQVGSVEFAAARFGTQVLEQLIRNDGLVVVGAEYSLETGLVEFFDGVEDG